jgi:hypothetical protein
VTTIGAPGSPERQAWEESVRANVTEMAEALRAAGEVMTMEEFGERLRRNPEAELLRIARAAAWAGPEQPAS